MPSNGSEGLLVAQEYQYPHLFMNTSTRGGVAPVLTVYISGGTNVNGYSSIRCYSLSDTVVFPVILYLIFSLLLYLSFSATQSVILCLMLFVCDSLLFVCYSLPDILSATLSVILCYSVCHSLSGVICL